MKAADCRKFAVVAVLVYMRKNPNAPDSMLRLIASERLDSLDAPETISVKGIVSAAKKEFKIYG